MDYVDAKQAANVMLAYSEGELIERCNNKRFGVWEDVKGDPIWDWNTYSYRVKKKPVYHPYTWSDKKEFFKDFQAHGPFVKEKPLDYYRSIEIVDFREGSSPTITVSTVHDPFTMEDAAANFVWQDGTTFGILKLESCKNQ